jgi:hypothetical protein
MTRNLERIFACRDLRTSPMIAMQAVMATRIATLYLRAGRDPLPDMAVRLRSMRAAQALQEMVSSIGDIWPDHFMVQRPCCMAMSPDETILADVATAALQGDRHGAQAAMSDLLPRTARDRLFGQVIELVDAIRAVPVSPASVNQSLR